MKQVLIDPADILRAHSSGKLVLVDTRAPENFLKGHILDAVNIPEFFTFLVREDTGGLKAMADFFARKLGECGIGRDSTIVFYEDAMTTGFGQSCRGHFVLNLLGHENVHVLNGGLAAWRRAALPLEMTVLPRTTCEYPAHLSLSRVATKEDVLHALRSRDSILLDCRDREEWSGASSSPYGRDFCPRKGRIPGAVWLEWYRLMERQDGCPMFRPAADCLKEFKTVGIDRRSNVIVYCFKGSRASNTLLAMQSAGILNARNYFASWNEWSRDLALPIDDRIIG